jgi:hypothetical protein
MRHLLLFLLFFFKKKDIEKEDKIFNSSVTNCMLRSIVILI